MSEEVSAESVSLEGVLRDLARVDTRQRLNVSQTVEMVTQLPFYAALDTFPDREGLPGILRVAALESYLLNVRLLGDFLIRMPNKDFSAETFLPSWSPEKDDSWEPSDADQGTPAQRLNYRWRLISEAVVHFGQARTPAWEELEEPLGTDLADLEAWTDDCLAVLRDFVESMETADVSDAGRWRSLLDQYCPPEGDVFRVRRPPTAEPSTQ